VCFCRLAVNKKHDQAEIEITLTKKQFTYYYLALSLLTGIFLITKAVVSPLVMDEATTFLDFVHTSDYFPGQGRWVANNHLLNSFLVAISTQLFGISEWAIRLPNLLAFFVFTRYIYLWGTQMQNNFARILFPVSVFASLYFIEFFAVARGYGLSLAFVFGGAYHLVKYVGSTSKKHLFLSFAFMGLAIFANLNMQFIYVVWWAIIFWNSRKQIVKNLWFLALSLIPILLTTWISFVLKSHGGLALGHNGNLLNTLKLLLYNVSFTHSFWWFATVILLFLITLLGTAFSLQKVKTKKLQPLHILLLFIGGNLLLVVASHFFLGVLYPVHQAAMHWFILGLPAFYLSLQYLPKKLQNIAVLGGVLLLGFQLNYMGQNFSTDRNSSADWKNEQIDEGLAKAVFGMSDPEITIAGPFLYQRQWRFLGLKLNPGFPTLLQTSVATDTLADYLLSAAADTILHSKYAVYKTDVKSGISLLKRKNELTKNLFARVEPDGFETSDSTHVVLNNFSIPNMGKQIGMRLEFDVIAEQDLLKSAVVLHFKNNSDYKIWKEFRLDHIYNDINSKIIVVNFLIPSQSENEITANVSFLNFDRKKYELTNVRCYFYSLEKL